MRSPTRMRVGFACAAFVFVFAATNLFAQTPEDVAKWPSRPVKFIVPTTAGGGNDASSRLIAEFLSKKFGQPFVIENIPGAGFVAGTTATAQAAPDGYTLVNASFTPIIVLPLLRNDLKYKPSDLTPVTQTTAFGSVLVVNPDKISAKTLPELIKLMKDNPDKLNYGSAGIGAEGHLAMELFMHRTGTKVHHVPFKGGNEVLIALLGGHVDLSLIAITTALPQIAAGKLRAVAVMPAQREPELPDVPTIKEIVPSMEGMTLWLGAFMPAATPRPIVDKLSAAMAEYLKSPAAAEAMKKLGARPVGNTPAEFSRVIEADRAVLSDVIKTSKITLE